METARRPAEKLANRFGKEIGIPEIQRKYVWTREKARALIDSLYKDCPSGSMPCGRQAGLKRAMPPNAKAPADSTFCWTASGASRRRTR